MLISKIEELSRIICGMQKSRISSNFIACDVLDNYTFSGGVCASAVSFKALSDGALSCDLIFNLKSQNSFNITVKAYLNGAEFDCKSCYIEGGASQHHNCFSVFAEKGEHTLSFSIAADSEGDKHISNCQAKIYGDIKHLSDNNKLIVFEDAFRNFCYCDKDYIYQKLIYNGGIYPMMRIYNRGDFTFNTCLHSQQSLYDTVFACCDEGKLYITIYPYHSSFETYRWLADENVTCVASAKSINPNGCMIYYLKQGGVYCMLLQKDDTANQIITAFKMQVQFCPLAVNITAISGGGWGYILREKPDKNTLRLFTGDFFQGAMDSANAVISAQIEE